MGTLKKFTNDIARKLNTLIMFISQFISEICVILGLFFIVNITFKLSNIAGYYTLGGILLILGLFLAKDRR